jgi:hypothetical protein
MLPADATITAAKQRQEIAFPPLFSVPAWTLRSAYRLVDTLVLKRTAHRLQFRAEGPRGLGRDPGVLVGGLLPAFDQREMILPVGLDHVVEAEVTRRVPALLRKAFHLGGARLNLRRHDIDVGQDHDGITRNLLRRADRKSCMNALVIGRALQGVERSTEGRDRRRRNKRLLGGLRLPLLDQGEMIGVGNALQLAARPEVRASLAY